jgi:hypothetical protein
VLLRTTLLCSNLLESARIHSTLVYATLLALALASGSLVVYSTLLESGLLHSTLVYSTRPRPPLRPGPSGLWDSTLLQSTGPVGLPALGLHSILVYFQSAPLALALVGISFSSCGLVLCIVTNHPSRHQKTIQQPSNTKNLSTNQTCRTTDFLTSHHRKPTKPTSPTANRSTNQANTQRLSKQVH